MNCNKIVAKLQLFRVPAPRSYVAREADDLKNVCNQIPNQSGYSKYLRVPDVVCCYTFGISEICIHVNFICVFEAFVSLKYTKTPDN